MRYFVSGYGDGKASNLRLYENEKIVWEYTENKPTWLAVSDKLLFAVAAAPEGSEVVSFLQNSDDPRDGWHTVSRIVIPGTHLCHLCADSARGILTGSCWGDGTFFLLPFHRENGQFGEIRYLEQQTDGTGRMSRCHCAEISGNFIYAANIELDLLFCYQLTKDGLCEYSHLDLPLGTGPRHIKINAEKKLLYLVTEYSNLLLTIDISNPQEMRIRSSYSILPASFAGCSTGSTLAITKDCRHLYTASRGADRIAHFLLNKYGMPVPCNPLLMMGTANAALEHGIEASAILQNTERTSYIHSGEQPKLALSVNKLTEAESFASHGKTPRHIALLENDTILAAANQDSSSVVFLKRDPLSGALSNEVTAKISFPRPTFILEV